ncbi:MAG: prepilin-type N-terminal cleavage/methylation domain-containing protein [Planctomycetota bacterium]|jgi:prepilin-type N-terminal cleavage/methylation domain-containing protein
MKRYFRETVKFTLVELLVVIAIISILAGMLLPALENALGSARQISCLNQEKQYGVAMQMYTNDSDGWMCPVAYNWVADLPREVLRNGPWPERLLDYMGGREMNSWATMFICPGDEDPKLYREDAIGNVPAGTNAKHSYGMNASLGDLERYATYVSGNPTLAEWFAIKKMEQVVSYSSNSSDFPVMLEPINNYLGDVLRWDTINYTLKISETLTRIKFPHSEKACVLFIGGNAASVDPYEMDGWPTDKYKCK